MAKKNKKQKSKKNQGSSNYSSQPALLLDYDRALKEARQAVARIDKRVKKTVPKGLQYDWLNQSNWNNIVYARDKIPERLLRLVERRNNIIGAIITLRIQQALEFSHVTHDKDIPGWEIVLRDKKETMSSAQEKQKEFLEQFMTDTCRVDYQGFEPKHDDFKDLLIKYIRDRILIDKVCWEPERNMKGEAIALWVLDGATILPVLPGGFYGSTSQIGTGVNSGFTKLSDEIRKLRAEQIPPVEEISYIQELIFGTSGAGITAAFRETDLIYDLGNEINDIAYYKQGLSVTEKANIAVTAFINSLTYNSNGLSRGAVPKIALAMGENSPYTQDELEDAQDEWMANFEGMDGQWNIPLLNSDARILNLFPNNRDMEYQKYMEFSGALICVVAGVDPAEIGLRLNQAQSVLSENQDAKQIFSKNRGIREMLGGFAYIVNKFLKISGYSFAKDFVFRFNGLNTKDKNFEAELRTKNVKSIQTVDEIRADLDLSPLPNELGKIILDPVWLQNKQAVEQQAMQEQLGEENNEESGNYNFDSDIDEAIDSLEKANHTVRLI